MIVGILDGGCFTKVTGAATERAIIPPSRRKWASPRGAEEDVAMRTWLLLILLICLGCALYLGFGTPHYGEKTAELISELEDM
jgi:hypothetical protein